MALQDAENAPLTFYDVAVSISEEEWNLLHEWQKERYKNVMKEVHQTLISLGYQIINIDTLVQFKKIEKMCFWDHQDAQRQKDINGASSSPRPDILVRIKREEKPFCSGQLHSRKAEIISPEKGFLISDTEMLGKEEAEADTGLMNSHGAEEDPSSPKSDHEIISLVIKEEQEPYFLDRKEFKRIESIKVHAAGDRAKPRKRKTGDSRNSAKNTIPSKASAGNAKTKILKKPTKEENSRNLQWTDLFLKMGAEKKEQCDSAFGNQSSSKFPLQNDVHKQSSSEHNNVTGHQRLPLPKRSYQCNECTKSFSQKSNLITHQRTHTGEKPFHCTVCGKSFNCKGVLIRHLRIHRGEKPYECKECGKSFNQKGSLIVHNRIHTGLRPYQCTECEKSFIVKGNLIGHERTHKGERPFQCNECGKSFSRKGDLILHQKSHSGERPYQCAECEKRFIRKSHLIRHYRTHTGDRPYLCSECGKSFSQKGNLIIHQKKHI